MQCNKDFLVIGNQNAMTYKEIFPLLKENKLWLGYYAGDMAFKVPDYYEPRATRYWQDETGQKWRSLGNICWYTNLDIDKRHEQLDLRGNYYEPTKYPAYDNYDAIEIGKVADIPCDYAGVMGVPITFMQHYSPDQFEILGCTESEGKGFSNGIWDEGSGVAQPLINGKKKYKRIFIRNKHPEARRYV